MIDDLYKKLARHLDNMPAGFPSAPSGVEIRLLKKLFSPEEAAITVNLTLIPEPPEIVADRCNINNDELSVRLESMAKKGLIFRSSQEGIKLYAAAQFVIGIWEFHVNNLDDELVELFNEYVPFLVEHGLLATKTKQMRVIPVSESFSSEMSVMPYDAAEELIRSRSKIAVSPCICRREHHMRGEGCDKPVEACFQFGTSAYFYVENDLGRFVGTNEALDLLQKAKDAGCVIQPGNAQRPANICMCCGCCCQVLKNMKKLPRPAMLVNSSYYAAVNETSCTACGECEDRCPMEAISISGTARINRERCIGCGLCVTACAFHALGIHQKSGNEQWIPPGNTRETYINIARERGLVKE